MSLRHGTLSLLTVIILASPGCYRNRQPAEPTPVARGLKFVSKNAAFDAFFTDLHDVQLDMLALPEQERNFRKVLAKEIKVDEGATTSVLAERAAAIAQGFASKGTTVKLDVEGLEAVDEADTAAQMRVSGYLEGEALHHAESIARAARSELKLLAHLNARGQTLQRLAGRATMLEAEVERAFAGSDPKQMEFVRRNLSDAKLLISVMDDKRLELSLESRRTVERLASAVTTNPALGSPNEPPLVTFVRSDPNRDRDRDKDKDKDKDKGTKAKAGGGPANARGGITKSQAETSAPAADFEP